MFSDTSLENNKILSTLFGSRLVRSVSQESNDNPGLYLVEVEAGISKRATDQIEPISIQELVVTILKNVVLLIWNGIISNYLALFNNIIAIVDILVRYFFFNAAA